MSVSSFISQMLPYAQQASSKTGIPTSVILSQWGVESAWGSSSLAQRANNFGGIKYWGDGYINDGQSGMYAKYNTVQRFTDAYEQFMGSQRYAGVRNAGTVNGALGALESSGYAEGGYGLTLKNVISQYNLTQYDGKKSATSSATTTATDQKKNDDNSGIGSSYPVIDEIVTIVLNGVKYQGYLIQDRSYIAVRALEQLGANISWDEQSKTANVSTK